MSEKKIRVWDIELCKDIELLKDNKVILYGAGVKGKEIQLKLLDIGIKVAFFCDSDVNKWNKNIENVKVISPIKLKQLYEGDGHVFVILCIQQEREVIKLLKEYQMFLVKVVSYWGIKTALFFSFNGKKNTEEYNCIELWKYRQSLKYKNIAIKYLEQYMVAKSNAVWILQPGKTASSTLEKTFEECNIPYIKQHTLNYPNYILDESMRMIWESTIQQKIKNKIKIVTAVREPLSRNYSAFWQAFTETLERAFSLSILDKDIQRMYNNFEKYIMLGTELAKKELGVALPYTWRDEFTWFDEEIKKFFGVDIYLYPFDKEKGYQIIRDGGVEIFIYKVEKINQIMDVLTDFIGVDKLLQINANQAKDKNYAFAYEQFRQSVRVSKEYVDYYYNSNTYMDHFYTEKEKSDFLDKWKGNIDDRTI